MTSNKEPQGLIRFLKGRHLPLCLLFLILFTVKPLGSVSRETRGTNTTGYRGTVFQKYLRNFNRVDCKGLQTNRCIIQDNRGVMYFGGEGGLREYDGVSWRTIPVPGDWVSALAVDDEGTVYVGGYNDFGCLTPTEKGGLQYRSLLHLLNEKQGIFNILSIHCIKDGIYFNAGQFLFRFIPGKNTPGGTTNVWKPLQGREFDFSFACRDEFFIQETNTGLMKMKAGKLRLLPGCKELAGETICMLTPFKEGGNKLLLGTLSKNLFIYDGTGVVPFPTRADGYLKKKRFIHGIGLISGDFALATFLGGVVVIDVSGEIKEIFNESTGLPDDLVNFMFEDIQGNLWLALEPGISKIENVSPIATHRNSPQDITSVTRYRNRIYVGSRKGLYYLTPAGNFHQVPGIKGCIQLLPTDDFLLVSTPDGVNQVDENNIIKIIPKLVFVLLQSQADKKRLWIQTSFTIDSLYRQNHRWIKEYHFEKSHFQHTMAEDQKGNLWLGARGFSYLYTTSKGVLRVSFPAPGSPAAPSVKHYDKSSGLPSNLCYVFKTTRGIIFSTNKGLYRFDEKKQVFIPDTLLGNRLASLLAKKNISNLVEDTKKNVWISFFDGTLLQAVLQKDGTYVINEKPFLRIPGHVKIFGIYPDPGGDIIWLYSKQHLIRFDPRVKKNYRSQFNTLIRRVTAEGQLIFAGYPVQRKSNSIPYKYRNLVFEFASPFFEGESAAHYRCRLEGYDDKWSDWAADTRVAYHLPDYGHYRFRVQGKNVYNSQASEATFSFTILPPWYRTWWAYLAYMFIFSMMVYLLGKWRRAHHLERETKRLEKAVMERTKEIQRKNRQLKEQTSRLKDQSRKLEELDKMKSRFFANISHQFRTPLALIMGPLEQMLAGSWRDNADWEKKLNLMMRNSQRLLRLIDQMLELSKLEGGHVKLQAFPQDIVRFIKGIATSFEPVINKYELDLWVRFEEENIQLYFDAQKMEEVIFNIFSNAIKFTPAGGKINVTLTRESGRAAAYDPGVVKISICDTGPGIPRDQLEHIFDRFYQADATYEHHKKGSGIGLAIARELVELHHGKIDVHSKIGEGTEFIIHLPVGTSHLEPGQIVEAGKYDQEKKTLNWPGYGLERDIENHIADDSAKNPVPGNPDLPIILVVEDSADFREYMKDVLEPFYTVELVEDGAAGIHKAKEIIPDLIISDIMMPGANGYQLCRELKNHRSTSHIPIILLTAKASQESAVQGLETGADDYITKPFSSTLLCARIKNLIELRRQLQLERRKRLTVMPTEINVSSVDETFYTQLVKVIDENISDPDFNVEQLVNMLCMGRTTLYRKLTALTGLAPKRFIRSYRMKRAAQLLESNFGNVSEVAGEVGFTNMAYFSQCFKEEFQISPSAFQGSASQSSGD